MISLFFNFMLFSSDNKFMEKYWQMNKIKY